MYRSPIPSKFAEALLPEHYRKLGFAITELRELVESANLSLAQNPLTHITSDALAEGLDQKYGPTRILVESDGSIILEVGEEGAEAPVVKMFRTSTSVTPPTVVTPEEPQT